MGPLTLLVEPPGRDGSGRHGQRYALAIVQEAGDWPGQDGGVSRARLLSPHQDSHTSARPSARGQPAPANPSVIITVIIIITIM